MSSYRKGSHSLFDLKVHVVWMALSGYFGMIADVTASEHLGEDRVGLGSDYDGAIVPTGVTTVADLPNLRQAMVEHGFDDALMTKLCHENWLRVLEKTWTKGLPREKPRRSIT